MAGENPRTRTGERGDAVSDTPRTDASAFGTDDESLNRLFGIRELPRYVVPVDFTRQLERELAAVTADLCTFAVDMERQLSASQQEARRLREALDAIKATARVDFCATSSPVMAETLAGIGKRCYAALSSTPAPVHKDTERLNFCDTMIDLEPGFYVLRFPVTESCTIRDAIDAAIDAELAKEGK